MTSVCTGALVYAAAGLLDGRPATTHWGSVETLAGYGVEVRPESRFVDDGDVVTAAGVSAGIDMALHLVARLDSKERARAVAALHPVRPRAACVKENTASAQFVRKRAKGGRRRAGDEATFQG